MIDIRSPKAARPFDVLLLIDVASAPTVSAYIETCEVPTPPPNKPQPESTRKGPAHAIPDATA